ncbi:MAG: DegT/DnrJ/EryC1/StrS family aminotransferase [Vicinamibacterales bacterium]
MTVPLLDLHLQYASIRAAVAAAVERVCVSQQFILGPEVTGLESELADAIGVRHAIAVSSGTDALLVALMAAGVGPGDEVITPTFSFFATAGCVSRLGARPVFVDIDPTTLLLDADEVVKALTPRTKAVIPVHLFGLCADVELLASRLPGTVAIIEDAAQAIGATIRGRQAGSLGTLGCFSFFPSKNLGAFGDAGLVTTNDDAMAARVRLLRTHGEETKYHHTVIGGNFRMDALQAAILRVKLPHLEGWTARRRANAATYARLFAQADLESVLTLPCEPQGSRHIYHQYVIRARERDRLKAHLETRNVGTAVYYPVPFHRQVCFADLPSARGAFPHADAACADVLALPVFPELTAEQLAYVVSSIAEAYR